MTLLRIAPQLRIVILARACQGAHIQLCSQIHVSSFQTITSVYCYVVASVLITLCLFHLEDNSIWALPGVWTLVLSLGAAKKMLSN